MIYEYLSNLKSRTDVTVESDARLQKEKFQDGMEEGMIHTGCDRRGLEQRGVVL